MELILYALLSYITRSGTFTRVGAAYFLYTGSAELHHPAIRCRSVPCQAHISDLYNAINSLLASQI
jgi:hypothetical protein